MRVSAIPHEEIKNLCLEYINNTSLDIVEEYEADAVADAAANLISCFCRLWMRASTTLNGKGGELQIKALNDDGGSYLSVSNGDATGVSDCLVYIVRPKDKLGVEDVAFTLDMINEAWYTLAHR